MVRAAAYTVAVAVAYVLAWAGFGGSDHVGLLGRPDDWQVGYSVPKGGYPELREAGVEPVRRFLREHVGWLADRADLLTDLGGRRCCPSTSPASGTGPGCC